MRVARRPSLAAVLRVVAGMITQRSNALVYVAVGLVSGGIIDKRRAILVPTRSQIGSAAIVVRVAVDLRVAASYAVAIAGFALFFGRNDRQNVWHADSPASHITTIFPGCSPIVNP